MHKRYYISDTHFSHANIITFRNNEGNLIRPFKTVEEMDELMVENWNKKVRDVDTIVHLGDFTMNKKYLPILSRLNGRKILIRGNHDIFETKEYLKYFKEIRSYEVLSAYGIIFSHIPIHTCQLEGRFKFNVHGHMHQNIIDDKRYYNICVENTNYNPLEKDEILIKLNGHV